MGWGPISRAEVSRARGPTSRVSYLDGGLVRFLEVMVTDDPGGVSLGGGERYAAQRDYRRAAAELIGHGTTEARLSAAAPGQANAR